MDAIKAYKTMKGGNKVKGNKGDIWSLDEYGTTLLVNDTPCKYFDLFMCETFELIEEEDNWNLAEKGLSEHTVSVIKKFIEKVKEDIDDSFPTPSTQELIHKKIDKRAGDL